MTKYTKVMTNTLNEREVMGTIVLSINSSMCRLIELGCDHSEVFIIKKKIDALSATFWSLIVMRSQEPNKELISTIKFLNDQIQEQLSDLYAFINGMNKYDEDLE